MVFTLTDIPRAMRQEGWPVGAAVMERWFAAGPARADQTCQLNFQRIESALFGDVDDFYAAIGRGSVKIAVAGDAVPLPAARIRLTIDEVGTSLRDTYDFNGDQMLGSWGPTGLSRARSSHRIFRWFGKRPGTAATACSLSVTGR